MLYVYDRITRNVFKNHGGSTHARQYVDEVAIYEPSKSTLDEPSNVESLLPPRAAQYTLRPSISR